MEYFKLKNHLYLNSFTNNEISQYNLTTDRHPWREKPMRERANRRTTATCRLRFALAQIAEYRNVTYTRNVMRKAERQDNEEEVELMITTFLNPAPRTPAIHGRLKRK